MENEIYAIFHLSIKPGDFADFVALIDKIIVAARGETDTLTYEYVVSDDRTAVHIVERYRTSGLVPHVSQTFAPFADEFLALAKIEQLFVYGAPTPEIRALLDGFGARYFAPLAGFTR